MDLEAGLAVLQVKPFPSSRPRAEPEVVADHLHRRPPNREPAGQSSDHLNGRTGWAVVQLHSDLLVEAVTNARDAPERPAQDHEADKQADAPSG